MVGITSYGAYIPRLRLNRVDIGKAWGAGGRGEKAVAYFDEDSITMAVAAARDCLRGLDRETIGGLYFATTTSPYQEKQGGATIGVALDLRRDIITADFGGSVRSGAIAMVAAMDAAVANPDRTVLICAADNRLGAPGGGKEMDFGDGAAALTIGSTGVIATIDGSYSIADEIIDVWRPAGDAFVKSWEDRFVREKGYASVVTEGVAAAMKHFQVAPQDIAKFVCYAPTPRDIAGVARKLGFDAKTQVQDTLYTTVGNTGTPLAMMVLVAALEEAKAGDKILLASYGDGCTTLLLTVTEEIEKVRDRRGIRWHLEKKAMLTNYDKYLTWREILPMEPAYRPVLEQPSATALWRDRKSGLALNGSKCRQCGTAQYPPQRICVKCQAKDDFDYYSFADKKGKIATFSLDNLAVSLDSPTVICAVDLDGGGRIMCDLIDRDIEEVRVGLPVEMTFRRLRKVGGISDYWWKCKPIRD
ncbi:MAG: OB-fold domain-containing protein [Chloroflexota bacterium]